MEHPATIERAERLLALRPWVRVATVFHPVMMAGALGLAWLGGSSANVLIGAGCAAAAGWAGLVAADRLLDRRTPGLRAILDDAAHHQQVRDQAAVGSGEERDKALARLLARIREVGDPAFVGLADRTGTELERLFGEIDAANGALAESSEAEYAACKAALEAKEAEARRLVDTVRDLHAALLTHDGAGSGLSGGIANEVALIEAELFDRARGEVEKDTPKP